MFIEARFIINVILIAVVIEEASTTQSAVEK